MIRHQPAGSRRLTDLPGHAGDRGDPPSVTPRQEARSALDHRQPPDTAALPEDEIRRPFFGREPSRLLSNVSVPADTEDPFSPRNSRRTQGEAGETSVGAFFRSSPRYTGYFETFACKKVTKIFPRFLSQGLSAAAAKQTLQTRKQTFQRSGRNRQYRARGSRCLAPPDLCRDLANKEL
jgi:hypothetical protein